MLSSGKVGFIPRKIKEILLVWVVWVVYSGFAWIFAMLATCYHLPKESNLKRDTSHPASVTAPETRRNWRLEKPNALYQD
jgi:hypothetical protein